MNEKHKKEILNFLEKNTDELITPKKLSEELNISYPTVLKYCEILEAEKIIISERVGHVKIIKKNNSHLL